MSVVQSSYLVNQLLAQMTNYFHSNDVRNHVNECLRQYPSLQPKNGVLPKPDGRQAPCICLDGTVPIIYRGKKYNIPMNIWVDERYPYAPPVTYVMPTKDMFIRPNQRYVDKFGRCFIPYISNWNSGSSNLSDMVTQLSVQFGREPPVSSGPQSAAAQHQHSHLPPQQQPPYQGQQYGVGRPQSQNYESPQQIEERKRREALNKLTARLRKDVADLSAKATHEIDKYLEEQVNLKNQGTQFEQGAKDLMSQRDSLKNELVQQEKRREELAKWIEENEKKDDEEISVDALVKCKFPVSEQTAKLTANDLAIEDGMYYLTKAVESGLVDPAGYLKEVRLLSRQQFKARALLRKMDLMTKDRMTSSGPGAGRGGPPPPPGLGMGRR